MLQIDHKELLTEPQGLVDLIQAVDTAVQSLNENTSEEINSKTLRKGMCITE